MAPAAVQMGVRELAAAANVSTNTITRFERGEELLPPTINAIRKALEDAGVKFLNAGKSGGGPGVRLKD
jgi:transcriptional regulator with XRE-family HTH domain